MEDVGLTRACCFAQRQANRRALARPVERLVMCVLLELNCVNLFHQSVSFQKGDNDFLIVQDVIKFQFSIFPIL